MNKTTYQEYKLNMPFSKRLFDLFFSVSALIITFPILLFVAFAILVESKGKVYYITKRVGHKPFYIFKLRSMHSNAENELKKLAEYKNLYTSNHFENNNSNSLRAELQYKESSSYENHRISKDWYNYQKRKTSGNNPIFIKIANDPRITKVGKLIRKTGIDELPQLINVIKGDMSIVGNRPLSVEEARLLVQKSQTKRFLAPAGITGLWQVKSNRENALLSEDERIRLDNEYADRYINDYSFWYDLKLISHTIPILWEKKLT